MQATIELENEAGYFKISAAGGAFGDEGGELAPGPKGMWSTEFTTLIVSGSMQVGGYVAGEEVPVRRMTLTLHLHDMGEGVEATVSRFRLMWGSPVSKLRPVTWRYTSVYSGERWLTLLLEKEILFSQEKDWNLQGYAKAVVSVVALEPRYESQQLEVTVTNPSNGEHTLWAPCWNPTDQYAWPEWGLKPNGTATFALPDFSFDQEQDIDPKWVPGDQADRMVVTPAINKLWSVMTERSMDPYVASDLSNAGGQMGGVRLLYPIPPHTGTADDPVMLPVIINGPAGAKAKLILRRFWSAESGLEA